MGNEQSGDQDSDKDELNQTSNPTSNQKDESPSKVTPSAVEKNVKTILSDMYPEDLKSDENISIIPTEANDIESKTIEESSPEFEDNLKYASSRSENFQTSFRTKAIYDKSMQNTLALLQKSIDSVNDTLLGKKTDEKFMNKLKKVQQNFEEAESDFTNNQSQITKEKSDQIYIELESAKDTLKKKREELDALKETCARLFRQYMEISNSQSV